MNVKYMAKHREYMKEWRKRNKETISGHRAIEYDLRIGRITYTGFCLGCGKKRRTQMHHRDPKRKREVWELCVPCHKYADNGKIIVGYLHELC
jgi:hypothetical protein